MKSKLLILSLLFWIGTFAQVPNSAVLSLKNDVYPVVHAHASGTTANLRSLFANAVDAYFDPAYKGSKDRLSNFRNYTVLICPSVGDSYEGGIVSYLFQVGDPGYVSGQCHGFIIATSDIACNLPYGTVPYVLSGANGTAFGTGGSNTALIVAAQGTSTIYAARSCYELTSGGKSDWVLPSRVELLKMFENRVAIGMTSTAIYWSSSEQDIDEAISIEFTNGNFPSSSKGGTACVRAIRYF